MKLLASLLIALLAQSATSNDEEHSTPVPECTKLEAGTNINETMYAEAERCTSYIDYKHMGPDPQPEVIRATIGETCNRKGDYARCLSDLETDARKCLDDEQQTRYRLFREFRILDFEVGCESDDLDIAVIYRPSAVCDKYLTDCRANATAQVPAEDAADVNGYMLHMYAFIHKNLECMEEKRGDGCDAVIDYIKTMGARMTGRMKCYKDDAEVLCSTLVATN